MNQIEQSIINYQDDLTGKIKKYDSLLTLSEFNMLNLLNRNLLLLDINKEVDRIGRVKLVAYDLERKIILNKII